MKLTGKKAAQFAFPVPIDALMAQQTPREQLMPPLQLRFSARLYRCKIFFGFSPTLFVQPYFPPIMASNS
jgi:hypothetical protein